MKFKQKIKIFVIFEIVFLAAFFLFLHFPRFYDVESAMQDILPYENVNKRTNLEITGFDKLLASYKPHLKVVWDTVFGSKNALLFFKKCDKYLSKNGVNVIDFHSVETQEQKENVFIMPTMERIADVKPRDRRLLLPTWHNFSSNMCVLVCLDPEILLVVPVPVEYYSEGKILWTGWADSKMREGHCFGTKDSEGLIWYGYKGFSYGTTFPYHKDIKWFSPELDVLPQELDIVSDTERRIKVNWGWLVFKHERVELKKDKLYRYDGEGGTYFEDCWKVYAEGPDYYE